MVSRLPLLTLAGALALAAPASAADLQAVDTYLAVTGSAPTSPMAADEWCPLDARVVRLGRGSAVIYYTYDEEGADKVRVVTTLGTDTDGVAPSARFVSQLAPGQEAEVSIGGPVGTEPATIELAYDGRRVTARAATAQPES